MTTSITILCSSNVLSVTVIKMFQTFCLIYSIIHDFLLHSILDRMPINCDAVTAPAAPQYSKRCFLLPPKWRTIAPSLAGLADNGEEFLVGLTDNGEEFRMSEPANYVGYRLGS